MWYYHALMTQQKAYMYIILHPNHITFKTVHENRTILHRRKCRSEKDVSLRLISPYRMYFLKAEKHWEESSINSGIDIIMRLLNHHQNFKPNSCFKKKAWKLFSVTTYKSFTKHCTYIQIRFLIYIWNHEWRQISNLIIPFGCSNLLQQKPENCQAR